MKIHAIVDYSFLYYKYKFQLDSGKMRRLTTAVECNGVTIEKDISQIYYSIREIEGFRHKLEDCGHEVVVSVCFDMPSARKEEIDGQTDGEQKAAGEYKANRVKRLGESDFENIRLVEKLLNEAGHNTYRIEGYEADDIVAYLVGEYTDEFDYNIIYTPDADLLVNVCEKVGASRFKARRGYTSVDMNNFEEYLSGEFKCRVPYNSLMLLKCTVGDSADNIKGIHRFGAKAFDKLVNYLEEQGVEWEDKGTYEKTLELLDMCEGYLKEDQIEQAKNSLSVVRPMVVEKGSIDKPEKVSNYELRKEAYMKYNMSSLVH